MSEHDSDHWLVRPKTIKLIWIISSVILALLVLLQAVIKVKGYFGVDGWFGFGAAYGFFTCVAMVLVAKGLGFVLKRPEDYYLKAETDADATAADAGDKDNA
jgi:sterol desaturase/sphingolipid hydroxylase (fatty acid hydroxylase superfamily)